jgi:predicted glycosyltransferase involved in capsule biosynthesis
LREEGKPFVKASIIIPWCNRPEIAQALPKNAEWLASSGAEVILVSSAGDVTRLRELIKPCGYPGIRLLHLEGVKHFNKPECLNVGAFFSRTDWVLTLDADIILLDDFLESGMKRIAGRQCLATVKEVAELGPEVRLNPSDPHGAVLKRTITTEVTHENGRAASIEYGVDKYGTRSGVGLVLVKREHFIAVQGLNSNMRGWGYEDFDFQIRLQLGLGLERVSLGRALHVTHPSTPTGTVSHARNIALAWQNYSQGKLDGTFDSDIDRLKNNVVELAL